MSITTKMWMKRTIVGDDVDYVDINKNKNETDKYNDIDDDQTFESSG